LNKDRLALLKPGAIIINTGRGALIDEQALYDLLKSGHLGGAGLDVFENEPYVPVHPDKDLRTLHNVVLTPHIGSSTIECAERMAKSVMQNIQLRMEGKYLQMDIKMG
jgi:lactate dehydrogenase-like 2-hydroxyacid dehydrogenase